MKAILVSENGSPPVLNYLNVKEPEMEPNDVKIKIHAAGVNFIDIYYRKGIYKRELPYIPGEEASGEIIAVGSQVNDYSEGDRVAFLTDSGSYSQIVIGSTKKMIKIPKNISYNIAGAAILQGLTAEYLTTSTFPILSYHKVLIHAAAGGVGLLLVQIAKSVGAFVIATTSTSSKMERVKSFGADIVCKYDDFKERVNTLTESGVDVVYDSVGKTTFIDSLSCIRPRGTMVMFGQSSGSVESFNPGILGQHGSIFLTRPRLGDYIASSIEFKERSSRLFDLILNNKLKITIDQVLPLEHAAKAHQLLEDRKTIGKLILAP